MHVQCFVALQEAIKSRKVVKLRPGSCSNLSTYLAARTSKAPLGLALPAGLPLQIVTKCYSVAMINMHYA